MEEARRLAGTEAIETREFAIRLSNLIKDRPPNRRSSLETLLKSEEFSLRIMQNQSGKSSRRSTLCGRYIAQNVQAPFLVLIFCQSSLVIGTLSPLGKTSSTV